jgi:hypothetical protein
MNSNGGGRSWRRRQTACQMRSYIAMACCIVLVVFAVGQYQTLLHFTGRNNNTTNNNNRLDRNYLPQRRRTPTIGFGQRRNVSNHFCVGPYININVSQHGDGNTERKSSGGVPSQFPRLMRSCHFTDVCFNSNGTMLYFASPYSQSSPDHVLSEELETVMHGQDRWRGPDHLDPTKRAQRSRNHDRWLTPSIQRRPPPTASCSWSNAPVAIPYIPAHMSNFGHNLMDTVMSFYRLMKMFDLYSDEIPFVPLRMHGSDYNPDYDSILLSKVLDPFLRGSLPEHSARHGHFSDYFAKHTSLVDKKRSSSSSSSSNDNSNKCLCFENVVSGRYYHTDHGADESLHGRRQDTSVVNPFWVGRGDLLRDFRDAYLARAGILESSTITATVEASLAASSSSSSSSVLILPRSNTGTDDNTFWNHTLVTEELSQCLLEANAASATSTIENNRIEVLFDIEKMPMVEQIRRISKTKVFVSMEGGASLLSIFLPPGSTAILLQRHNNNHDNIYYDDMVYQNIPYFHVWREPTVPVAVPVTVSKHGGPPLATAAGLENFYNRTSLCQQVLRGMERFDMARETRRTQAL